MQHSFCVWGDDAGTIREDGLYRGRAVLCAQSSMAAFREKMG